MATSLDDESYPTAFAHPAGGQPEMDPSRVAIRRVPGAPGEARDALLGELVLVPARLDGEPRRPTLEVNNTDGLWWAQRSDGEPADLDLLVLPCLYFASEFAARLYRNGGGRKR